MTASDDDDERLSVDIFDCSTPSPDLVTNDVEIDDGMQPSTSAVIDENRPHSNEKCDVSYMDKKINEQFIRKRNKALAVIEGGNAGYAEEFHSYMNLKKAKLQHQVNFESRPTSTTSSIFEGISIFVNGHTAPSALELRDMIQANGGEYHCYAEPGRTTYTVATELANVKISKTAKTEVFIKPNWIVDCIAAGRRLPIEKYYLFPAKEAPNQLGNFFTSKSSVSPPSSSSNTNQNRKTLDARDPNFLQEFYSRSRLHLISTLAQDMKDYMNGIRENENFKCTAEENLSDLRVGNSPGEPVIFHIDLDSFFVSVGIRKRSDLQGVPIAITHSKGSANTPGMSEVASCSYAARAVGVKNGMLVREALKRCPTLKCLPYQFDEYRNISKTIYTIVARYTKEVRAVSCDEMFVNFETFANELGINNMVALANRIRSEIKKETGCPASVGIGPNVLIARLATRHAKPDGVRWCRQDEVMTFISNEKVENLPGVGQTMMEKLEAKFGPMKVCQRLQQVPQSELEALFGKKVGSNIYKVCRGEDSSSSKDFLETTVRKSVSCDVNYGIRFTVREEAVNFIKVLCKEIENKLATCRMTAGSLTLKVMVRSSDAPLETQKYLGHGKCDTFSKSVLFKTPISDSEKISEEVMKLYDQLNPTVSDLRGVGIHCGRLTSTRTNIPRRNDVRDFFKVQKPSSQDHKKKERLQFILPTLKTPEKTIVTKKVVEQDKVVEVEEEEEEEEEATTSTCIENVVGVSPGKITLSINQQPSFHGFTDLRLIRRELDDLFLEVPTESSVQLLVDYFYDLSRGGHLSTLLTISKYIVRLLFEDEICFKWSYSVSYLFSFIDDLLIKYYGAPMITPCIINLSI